MNRISSLIDSLRKKNLLSISIIILLVVAIPLTIYLVRTQKIFKGRAHEVNISHIDFPELRGTPPTTASQNVKLKLTYGTGSVPSSTPTPTPSQVPIPQPLPCTNNKCVTGVVLYWNDRNSNSQMDLTELSPFGTGALGALATTVLPAVTSISTFQTDLQGRFRLESVGVTDPATSKFRLLIYASKRAVGGNFSQAGNTADNVILAQQHPLGTLNQYPASSFVVFNDSSTNGYIYSPEFQFTSAVTINVVFAGTGTNSVYSPGGGGSTPTPTTRPAATPTYAPGDCSGACTYTACTGACGSTGTRFCTKSGSGCRTIRYSENCQTAACAAATPTPSPTPTPKPCKGYLVSCTTGPECCRGRCETYGTGSQAKKVCN